MTYGLVVGLVAIGSLAAVTRMGDSTTVLFGTVSSTLTGTQTQTSTSPSPSEEPTNEPGLYDFTTFEFSSCGATGRYGPDINECHATYSEPWTDQSYFDVVAGMQRWTVPATDTYRITVAGAKGGDVTNSTGSTRHRGGRGAVVSGTFSLTEGERLLILVGQPGQDAAPSNYNQGGGGGGGSYVARGSDRSSATPLIIGGGGGGRQPLLPKHL